MSEQNQAANDAAPVGSVPQIVRQQILQIVKLEVPAEVGKAATMAPPPGFTMCGMLALHKSPIVGSKEFFLAIFETNVERVVAVPAEGAAPREHVPADAPAGSPAADEAAKS